MAKFRLMVELDEALIPRLEREAMIRDFKRVDPRRRWGARERREAARYAVESIVSDQCTDPGTGV